MGQEEYYQNLIKKKLHPVFWNSNEQFNEEVAKRLQLIAEKFYDSLDLDAEIKDIYLIGSLANYNWHSLSDLDLHIILDYDDISDDNDLVEDYLELERKQWNEEHDIEILGFPVEVSFNDEEDIINSSGIYSALNNEWVVKPTKKEVTAATVEESENIYNIIVNAIEDLSQRYEDTQITNLKAYQQAKKIWKIIKKLRSEFLEEEGEFGPKNLTFKRLRNEKYLEKLSNLKTNAHDDIFSIYSFDELDG